MDKSTFKKMGMFTYLWVDIYESYSRQNLGIFIPCQQRIFTALGLCVPNISPSFHKLLMASNKCKFARNSTVQIFNYVEICWEKDIKVALMDLYKWNQLVRYSQSASISFSKKRCQNMKKKETHKRR